MEIHADRDVCIGSGQCLIRLPAVFTQDDEEGLVEVLQTDGASHSLEELRDVEDACPAQAIFVNP